MRSVRGIGRFLAPVAPALLVAMFGVGCGGNQASGQERPESPEPVVVAIVGDGLLPGDRRAPVARTVTTAEPRLPIGRTKSPVPVRAPPTLTGTPGS
jgi:hypothetical protein